MSRIEFRDGVRDIPDYLADIMVGLPVHRLTYDESVLLANENLTRQHINKVEAKIIEDHARDWGWRR